jgi:outer membrane receptor protein involved in Fe transport
VKGGFGNYTTPYGEFFYNTLHSRNYSLGARLKHLSASGKIKEYAHPGFSDNEAEVYGRRFFTNHLFSGRVGFDRNVVHYYGYKPDDFPLVSFSKNDIKQRFTLLTAETQLSSLYNPESLRLNHIIDIRYYNLMDKYGSSENNIFLNADINKELKLFKLTRSQVLGVTAKVDYFFNADSLRNANNGIVSVSPYLRTKFRAFALNIGVDISVDADTTSYLHFYPIADVQVNIVRDILIVYGGVKGSLQKNSFLALTRENPFVSSIAPMQNTSEKFHVFGGIRSNISKEVNANAWASYALVDDMALFVADTGNGMSNIYTVVYDNAKVFHIRGEVQWLKTDKVSLRLGGNFRNYQMANELKAWHKPYFDVFANFRYNIASKIIVTSDLFVISDRYAKRYTGQSVLPQKLQSFVDGNIGIEYRYNKRLGAFLNINNIAAAKYYRWHNYRAYGFNLLGGVSYCF